jgi:enamine deaminase RidA (YjgF/YER057c/UK114 family)
MGKLMGCLLVTTLLLFSTPAEKSGKTPVVSVQIYLTDMSQFDQVNSIYKSYFASPYPARTTVQVAKLSLGARIEVAAIAYK